MVAPRYCVNLGCVMCSHMRVDSLTKGDAMQSLEYYAINFATRMAAEVEYVGHRRDGNKYRVILRDLESDSIVYPISFFSTLSAASEKADVLADVAEIAS